MSEVSVLLSSRVVMAPRAPLGRSAHSLPAQAAPERPIGDDSRSLEQLAPGNCAVIDSLGEDLPAATARRLFDLGFTPGAPITVLRRAPLRDPIIVRVADYDIALRREQARSIRVSGDS